MTVWYVDLIGAITLAGAGLLHAYHRRVYPTWRRTTGTVTGMSHVDTDDGPLKVSVVVFTDALGGGRTITDSFLALTRPKAGAALPVLEHPTNPDKSVVDLWYCRYGGELLLGFVGVLFFVCGALGMD